jgi:hypothetical protein
MTKRSSMLKLLDALKYNEELNRLAALYLKSGNSVFRAYLLEGLAFQIHYGSMPFKNEDLIENIPALKLIDSKVKVYPESRAYLDANPDNDFRFRLLDVRLVVSYQSTFIHYDVTYSNTLTIESGCRS